MSRTGNLAEPTAPRLRLWCEFGAFFVLAPLLIAVLFPPSWMFPALFTFTGIGIFLLHHTPGFSWVELRYGWNNWSWGELAVFAGAMAALCTGLVLLTRPDAAFVLLLNRPEVLAVIWVAYPLVSALPQELLFRPLFYRRYHAILPDGVALPLMNAALFAFAHLMYWNWIVAAMTFAGGLLFSWGYRARGSFYLAVLLHAIAGNIIFAAGLGVYFYSGNVQRPF